MKLFINNKIQLRKRLTVSEKRELNDFVIFCDKNYKFINVQKCTFYGDDISDCIDIIHSLSKLKIIIEFRHGNLYYNEIT